MWAIYFSLVTWLVQVFAVPGMGRSEGISFTYLDPAKTIESRVDDLMVRISRQLRERTLTIDDLGKLLIYVSPELRRGDVQIPKFRYTNEALHGLSGIGRPATSFPQSIGLAATWDLALAKQVGDALSTEGRAVHHQREREGCREISTGFFSWKERCPGLTFFAPVINIARDPRWGRVQETFGEDPFLSGQIAVSYVQGIQGDDPDHLKAVAVPKHFVVHSGPDAGRRHFEPNFTPHDLRETYLPAFEAALKQGGAQGVMCSYNKVYGKPACANREMLTDLLRDKWHFGGFVVTDCNAISDIVSEHHWAPDVSTASARAVQAGTDVSCGLEFTGLGDAYRRGKISEADILTAVRRTLAMRMRLGQFDPPGTGRYEQIPISVVGGEKHRQLSRQVAEESIVLLKNARQTLPFGPAIKKVAVIGPNGSSYQAMRGSYAPEPPRIVSIQEGLAAHVKTSFSPGSELGRGTSQFSGSSSTLLADALASIHGADAVVLALGLSANIDVRGKDGKWREETLDSEGQERVAIELPSPQQVLLKAVTEVAHREHKPVVLLLVGGSAFAIPWADDHVDAVLDVWYPGEEGGSAVANVLFGQVNPAGRLPLTFYRSTQDLPQYDDYKMEGRTYRYLTKDPLYPFGYGISYTHFQYDQLRVPSTSLRTDANFEISVRVGNLGKKSGDELVQLYAEPVQVGARSKPSKLIGFKRVHLGVGESRTLIFRVSPTQLAKTDVQGIQWVKPGRFKFSIGGHQPGFVPPHALSQVSNVLQAELELRGAVVKIP